EAKEDGRGGFLLEKIQATAAQGLFYAIWEDSKGRLFCSWESTSLRVLEAASFKLLEEIPIAGFSQSFWENPEDGSIWIGNSFGLFRLDLDLTYRGNQLPEQSFIYCLLSDRQGRLWLSTNKGLARFDRATGAFQTYSLADGLSALQYNWFAALKQPSGEIWFGSTNGITTFLPEKVREFAVAANPVITKIFIYGVEATQKRCAKTGAANFSEMKVLELDYQENTLAFEFAALEYADPGKVHFQYKMEGYEAEWVKAETNNQARYPKLPSGNYTFLVKASNSDGIWNEKERRLEIFIQPPVWETWWFILMATIMVGFFGYSIFLWLRMRRRKMKRLKLEQQLALEQQRQRIARDMHDDIGSGLSALSMRAEIAAFRKTPEDLRTEINKIHTSASELSGKIREVIWAVGASNDSLPNLISYLHQYTLDLFENADLDCFVNLPPGEIPNRKVYGEHRRSVFLAYKEALNNISKHSGATSISISFSLNVNDLVVQVADNGNGFSPHLLQQSTGNGLLNMKNRMVDIGGHCEIKTSAAGTQIRFVLPLAG
ncbi:MAG: triple tyrosine motif-containing protein, partial [Bacteroidota bacterium]